MKKSSTPSSKRNRNPKRGLQTRRAPRATRSLEPKPARNTPSQARGEIESRVGEIKDTVIGVAQEITERKKAEAELERRARELTALRATQEQRVVELERAQRQLHDSEALYESLVENLPQSVLRKDLEGRFTVANRRFCEDLGKSRAEVLGKTDFDFHPRALAEQYRADDQQICARGKVFETVEEHHVLGGEPIFVQVIKSPTYDANGNLTGMQGIFWDVTARKRAETILQQSRAELEKLVEARTAELAQERNLLRTLIDRLPDAIYVKDPACRYLVSNPAHAAFLGVDSPDAIVGKTAFDFFQPEDAEQFSADDQAVMRSGQPLVNREEHALVRVTGKSIWNLTTKIPLRDAAGEIIGLVGIARDITERKKAEAELKRRANELGALYETTRDIATQQDLPTLLRSIVERAAALLAAPGGAIYLYDATRSDLQIMLATDPRVPVGARVNLGEGMAGRVAQTRQPLIVNDYQASPYYLPQYAQVPFSAVIEVPMLYGGDLIGVLAVQEIGGTTHQFTETDARLLSLFAIQAAGAVHNARLFTAVQHELAERKQTEETLRNSERRSRTLYAAAQRQSQELQVLDKVRTALARELDLAIVFRTVVESVSNIFEHARVTLYQLHGDDLVREQIVGTPGEFTRIPVTRGVMGRVIRTGKPVLLADVSRDPDFIKAADEIVSEVCVPLFDQGKVAGVLNLESTGGVKLGEPDLRLMVALSEQIGIAITRARLYAETRDSEKRFRVLFDSSPDAVVLMDAQDPNWVIVDCNQTACRMNGYSREELVGRSIDNINVTIMQPAQRAAYLKRLRHHGVLYNTGFHRRKDGTVFPIELSTTLITLQGKELMLGIDHDVTQRKRAEATLRQQATHLQIAAEVARTVTTLLDIDKVLPRVADLIRERFGYYHAGIFLTDEQNEWVVLRASSGEGVGHDLEHTTRLRVGTEGMIGFVAGIGKPRVAQDVAADGAFIADPLLPATRAEAAFPLRIGATIIGVLDVQDKVVNAFPPDVVSILATIADQIAVAIQNARLHQIEKQRAQELEQAYQVLQQNQAQLLIAEKMASLGRLTAGIAHEMNTPLAAVRAALIEIEKLTQEYQTSLGDADVTPDDHRGIANEMQQSVRLAGTAAERAASFVRGIKTQTRDLSARESQRFNAVPVIRETLLLLGHTLRAGNCRADFEPDVELVELNGSPGRLAQVITNLVTNAVDACAAQESGVIAVRLTARSNEVELQVSDTGSGIAPEIISKIYEPMFTTKPFGLGTGLGLAIVHDIVTGEFGGTIIVASQISQGTQFTLRFPKSKED